MPPTLRSHARTRLVEQNTESRPLTPLSADKASVTVVIPAFNEQANIARLTQQIVSEPWRGAVALHEIIIVDDCSADKTPEIADELAHMHECVRVIHHARRGGKNAGMRTGLAACRSDIIAFVDSDVRLAPQCLTKTIKLLIDDPTLAGTSCLITPLPPRSWRERASRFQALLIAELRRHGQSSLARVYALRTEAIATLSLPDTIYDDLYIMRWLRSHGYRYDVCGDTTAFIRSAAGLRDFAKQTLRTWRAEQALEQVLPGDYVASGNRKAVVRAVARAAVKEPAGFMLYLLWRGLITLTPGTFWLPVVDHSRYDTSMSTKDLGA